VKATLGRQVITREQTRSFYSWEHPEVVITLDTISLGVTKAEDLAGMLSCLDKMQAVDNENQ
jgi:hypothetical protein